MFLLMRGIDFRFILPIILAVLIGIIVSFAVQGFISFVSLVTEIDFCPISLEEATFLANLLISGGINNLNTLLKILD